MEILEEIIGKTKSVIGSGLFDTCGHYFDANMKVLP